MREAMWLVHHGVPFATAFQVDESFRMDRITRAALCIVCAEFEGQRFNWASMQFDKK